MSSASKLAHAAAQARRKATEEKGGWNREEDTIIHINNALGRTRPRPRLEAGEWRVRGLRLGRNRAITYDAEGEVQLFNMDLARV